MYVQLIYLVAIEIREPNDPLVGDSHERNRSGDHSPDPVDTAT